MSFVTRWQKERFYKLEQIHDKGWRKLIVGTKFFQKIFTGETHKQAYLKTCKWMLENVILAEEIDLHDTYHKVIKLDKEEVPTYRLELYAVLENKTMEEHFCTICKEMHSKFYLNTEYCCAACKQKAYVKQTDHKLRIKKSYRKDLLKRQLNREE